MTYTQAFMKNFLGSSPDWYKLTIIAFLVINPIFILLGKPICSGLGTRRRVYFHPCYGIKMLSSSTGWFISR